MINKKSVILLIFMILLLFKYADLFSKSNNNCLKLAVYDYKFNLIKVLEVEEIFNEINNVISEENNYQTKNSYLKNELKSDNEYYYILVANNDEEINKVSKSFNNIEILFEKDYYSYWTNTPNTGFFDNQIIDAPNEYLFENISLPNEVLPDGHWLLYENSQYKQGLLMEFTIHENLLDGYLINYDIEKEEIKSYRELTKGFFNGFYYFKSESKIIFKYYRMGKFLNSITIE